MTKEEFGQRVIDAQGRMYRVARGYLRDEHDCLDAVSEAILKAWQKRQTLRDEGYFETWLMRILTRECLNLLRGKKRMIPMESLPEKSAPPSDDRAVMEALDALPQKYREVMVLHYMEGYGVKEVAAILRRPKGTVCSQLHYACLRLRDMLKEEIE